MLNHQLGRDVLEHLAKFRIARLGCRVDLLAERAKRRDLPRLELGLGENLAIHLHEHLLDDLRPAAPRRAPTGREEVRRRFGFSSACELRLTGGLDGPFECSTNRSGLSLSSGHTSDYNRICYTLSINSLNNPPTRSKMPPCTRGSSLFGRRISSFVNPGLTSPVRARAVHHEGAAWDRMPLFLRHRRLEVGG